MMLKNKKILVTGADGFIGSHLVESLLAQGAQVRAFVYYNSFNSWGWLDTFSASVLEKLEIFAGDIRDPNGVRAAVKDVEVVFHLAALIGIPFSYHSPDSYVDTNIKGTLNILQACRDHGVVRVVVTSTSEVYGTARYTPIDEGHPLQGQSPYSASKIGADKIAESFYRSFKTPVVIARPFNTYGPRQSARAVIPTIITQLLHGSDKVLLGDTDTVRDFNYVEDICSGFISLVCCDDAIGREINIGSGKSISIGRAAQFIIDEIRPAAEISSEKTRYRPKESEVRQLICDNSRINSMTGWCSRVPFEDGLRRTIEWFRENNNLDRYKWDIYNV